MIVQWVAAVDPYKIGVILPNLDLSYTRKASHQSGIHNYKKTVGKVNMRLVARKRKLNRIRGLVLLYLLLSVCVV